MTIAKILVPMRGDGKGTGVLAHASVIARAANAHVEAVFCRARVADFMPIGVTIPGALRDQIKGSAAMLAEEEGAALKRTFLGELEALGLAHAPGGAATAPADTPSASWQSASGKMADVIRAHGRLADIVAVAKPDRDGNLGVNSLRAALFQTARPVLICPPGAPQGDFTRRIAIAWNGALEATRTLSLVTPLLHLAGSVVVLDGGSDHEATSGEALVAYLAAHGVTAERLVIDGRDNPGRAILSVAAESGAGLLVCGAYGQSHEHETIFGGATQTVVDTTTMPVLMAH